MANWSEINNSFTSRLNTLWAETPIAFDNVDYTPVVNTEWIRATLIPAYSENAQLAVSTMHYGIFWIQIFVPLSSGTGRAYEIATMLDAIFSNKQFNEVVCYAAETSRAGDDGNGWYRLDFRVNFWSNERNI